MSESKQDIAPLSADDAPEWSDEVFDRAEVRVAGRVAAKSSGTLTKPGRPRLATPKQQVTLRLDAPVLEHFRRGGAGWQSRINDALKKAVETA